MKRILITLFAIGMTAMSSMSMAAMSSSQIRKETRFLTDKMAYELHLTTPQYNDVYEINYDFIYSIRYLMDDVVRGYEWALRDYYEFLDVRNDDLRWVLSDRQYRSFLGLDYFYRPIYMNGPRWSFRVYINYPNTSLFFFSKPYHYRTYSGAHYRTHYNNVSYYRGRYNHNVYGVHHSVRDDRVYTSNRRSDFGSVPTRSNSSVRPVTRGSKNAPMPPTRGTATESRSTGNDNRRESTAPGRSETPTRNSSRSTTSATPENRSSRGTSRSNSSSNREKSETVTRTNTRSSGGSSTKSNDNNSRSSSRSSERGSRSGR